MRLPSAAAAAALAFWIAAGPAVLGAPQHEDSPGAIEETPQALQVTTAIQCFCGTCVNQTLHDCTCGVAARERQRVQQGLDAGQTPDELIAAYIEDHGEQVRLVPLRSGLNLIGWAVPFVAAGTALIALTALLVAWRRRGASAEVAARGGAVPDRPGDTAYRERLARDLREIDRW